MIDKSASIWIISFFAILIWSLICLIRSDDVSEQQTFFGGMAVGLLFLAAAVILAQLFFEFGKAIANG